MCKHVAAVLYGIGARLDEQPELLFKLRRVNEKDLVAEAGMGLPLAGKGPSSARVLSGSDLAELFGLEMGQGAQTQIEARGRGARRAKTPAAGKVARVADSTSQHRKGPGVNAATKKKRKKKHTTK